jgi:hypothetical protein
MEDTVIEDPTWTYQHDLTAKDMIVNMLGRDRATVRVDRKIGPDAMTVCLLWRKKPQL